MTLRPCCSPDRIASAPAASQGIERAEAIKGVATMTTRSAPRRHWRSYGTDPLPSGAEAMGEPFAAFPEAHVRWRHRSLRDIMRECGTRLRG